MKHKYLVIMGISTIFNSFAAENSLQELSLFKDKVKRAIVKVEHTQKELWAYKVSRYENEEGNISSSIERYSPKASKPWVLKQINGQQPSREQIINFAKEKQKQEGKQNSIQLKLRDLIIQESLSLVSVDEKKFIMAFNVNIKKLGKDAIGKLQGQLTYQKDKQFIEKITIWNNAAFSPMFTANITDLTITFTFLHIDGAVLNKQSKMKMKGSFAYFTEINEVSLDTFSGYLYQGKATN